MPICIHTIFGGGRPLVTGVRTAAGLVKLYDLYRPGTGLRLSEVERRLELLKRLIVEASGRGYQVAINDFKAHLDAFRLPLCRERYAVYDLHMPQQCDPEQLPELLEAMANQPLLEYQRVLANAAVVYQCWQERGILHGGLLRHTEWTQRTSTGRSAAHGFNIQGLDRSGGDLIGNPEGLDSDVLVHCDWIAADIRFACWFSGDEQLQEAFHYSDPYSYLVHKLGLQAEDRANCKLALLKGINSMDVDSPVFEVYRRLGRWIARCGRELESDDSYLDTIMGRRYGRSGRSKLQVLNACMQGSVAHAMQLVIRRLWEQLPGNLLCEIHDGLVLTCPGNSAAIRRLINTVAPVMLRPFAGIAGLEECDLPLRVSVGRAWHRWSELEVHRATGVTKSGVTKSESATEEAPAPAQAQST